MRPPRTSSARRIVLGGSSRVGRCEARGRKRKIVCFRRLHGAHLNCGSCVYVLAVGAGACPKGSHESQAAC
eukprot:6201481-Pleurochrysis_carterae.AAC.3